MGLEEKVWEAIQKYQLIQAKDIVVVGVSGGPDSMALLRTLLILKETKQDANYRIVVAHVNHGLRKEADEETCYVEEFCRKYQVDCYVKKIDVAQLANELKIGTEEAGRKARYDFFAEVKEKVQAQKIATAHHANDNAETVLMNMIRGSSMAGLKGIEPIRAGIYIRPLLYCTRKEIEEYCEEQTLLPKIDASNQENIYTRNKIRNLLIPMIEKEFNPNIVETINRLSELAMSENAYLEKQTKKIYAEILLEESLGKKGLQGKNAIILSLKKFNGQDFVIKSRLVLYTINRLLGNSKDIEKIHIEDIIKLCEKNVGNKFLIPNKKVKVLVNKGKIFFLAQ